MNACHHMHPGQGTGLSPLAIAVILVLAELVAVFVRIVLDVLAVATAVRRVAEAPWFVIEGASVWVVVAAV